MSRKPHVVRGMVWASWDTRSMSSITSDIQRQPEGTSLSSDGSKEPVPIKTSFLWEEEINIMLFRVRPTRVWMLASLFTDWELWKTLKFQLLTDRKIHVHLIWLIRIYVVMCLQWWGFSAISYRSQRLSLNHLIIYIYIYVCTLML